MCELNDETKFENSQTDHFDNLKTITEKFHAFKKVFTE